MNNQTIFSCRQLPAGFYCASQYESQIKTFSIGLQIILLKTVAMTKNERWQAFNNEKVTKFVEAKSKKQKQNHSKNLDLQRRIAGGSKQKTEKLKIYHR